MADKTGIEWTDATWTAIRARNKLTGKVGWHCEHATPGCEKCYSEGMNRRLGTGLPFKPGHRADIELFLDEKMLLQPLRWKRPRMIFVCSMTDLFADFVPDEWIDQVFAVMALAPQHTFQVLTKRSARMRAYLSDPDTIRRIYTLVCDMVVDRTMGDISDGLLSGIILIAPGIDPCLAPPGTQISLDAWPIANCWLGVSAEDQRRADERVPDLLATLAAVRFVSAEPLLGPIAFRRLTLNHPQWNELRLDALTGLHDGIVSAPPYRPGFEPGPSLPPRLPGIDWLICGGESGPNARPMHPNWARSIRDQCAAAGVAFHFKQWGAWAPYDLDCRPESGEKVRHDWMILGSEGDLDIPDHRVPDEEDGECAVVRVGKKAAGRLLDGVEHNGMPLSIPTPSFADTVCAGDV